MHCGEVFGFDEKPGNLPMYCSNACKQRAYRARKRRGSQAQIKTRVNLDAGELTLTINGGKYLLTEEDILDLTERLIRARQLMTAAQTGF